VLECGQTLIGNNVRPYLMPRSRSVNVDDEDDLAFADLLLRRANATAAAIP
jgi:CMP-N-acetylneuraminic acid synthetase